MCENENNLLAQAVVAENERAVELLVMLGANPFEQNYKGKSAFDLSLRSESDLIQRWIVAAASLHTLSTEGKRQEEAPVPQEIPGNAA